jgi:hypothetical protein
MNHFFFVFFQKKKKKSKSPQIVFFNLEAKQILKQQLESFVIKLGKEALKIKKSFNFKLMLMEK